MVFRALRTGRYIITWSGGLYEHHYFCLVGSFNSAEQLSLDKFIQGSLERSTDDYASKDISIEDSEYLSFYALVGCVRKIISRSRIFSFDFRPFPHCRSRKMMSLE